MPLGARCSLVFHPSTLLTPCVTGSPPHDHREFKQLKASFLKSSGNAGGDLGICRGPPHLPQGRIFRSQADLWATPEILAARTALCRPREALAF